MKSLYVYTYHHWDYFEGIKSAKIKPDELEAVSKMFAAAGWEGDGEIQKLAVPPFFFAGSPAEVQFVYHVKQSNNGTSFFGVERDLAVGENISFEGKFSYGMMAVKA